MKADELPLLELFTRLRQAGLPLGMNEYQLVLQALQSGFGIPDREALARLCRTLWVKSEEDQLLFNYHFEQVMAEDASALIVPESDLGLSLLIFHSRLKSFPLILYLIWILHRKGLNQYLNEVPFLVWLLIIFNQISVQKCKKVIDKWQKIFPRTRIALGGTIVLITGLYIWLARPSKECPYFISRPRIIFQKDEPYEYKIRVDCNKNSKDKLVIRGVQHHEWLTVNTQGHENGTATLMGTGGRHSLYYFVKLWDLQGQELAQFSHTDNVRRCE